MTDQPVCVITGPTHGIGRVTAQAMAVRGYRVVLACRNEPL
jgi:short-subunit dehydrogenase